MWSSGAKHAGNSGHASVGLQISQNLPSFLEDPSDVLTWIEVPADFLGGRIMVNITYLKKLLMFHREY